MGGAYEDEIETKSPKIAGTAVAEGEVTGIRYHLVGGMVHFHDGKAKTKVEVPISDWLKGWEVLRNPREVEQDGKTAMLTGRFTYSNPDRNTLLLGQSTIVLGKTTLNKAKGGTAELSLAIIPITYDPAWTALEGFRNKGR